MVKTDLPVHKLRTAVAYDDFGASLSCDSSDCQLGAYMVTLVTFPVGRDDKSHPRWMKMIKVAHSHGG